MKISGDTRFDRVVSILERDNSLDFITAFCHSELVSESHQIQKIKSLS